MKQHLNISIGQRIRLRRESLGYSREKLSELADVNDKYLYEIEVGRKGLSLQKAHNISLALGISLDFIVNGEREVNMYSGILNLLDGLDETEIFKTEKIIKLIISFKN